MLFKEEKDTNVFSSENIAKYIIVGVLTLSLFSVCGMANKNTLYPTNEFIEHNSVEIDRSNINASISVEQSLRDMTMILNGESIRNFKQENTKTNLTDKVLFGEDVRQAKLLLFHNFEDFDYENEKKYIYSDNLISNVEIVEEIKEAEKIAAEEEAARLEEERLAAEKEAREKAQQAQQNLGFLVTTDNVDPNYKGVPWTVDDRYLLECLVTGEYGNDYIGAVLTAQTLRDTMVEENTHDIAAVIVNHQYSGRTDIGVSENAKKAVAFVFDEGGAAVQHPLKCFYASNLCQSDWHEKQEFVYQHQYVRFFYY